MGRYVDGFVIPVRKDRIEDYRRIAEQAAPIWKEFGALDYWECVGDDLDVKDLVTFPPLAQAGVPVMSKSTLILSFAARRTTSS